MEIANIYQDVEYKENKPAIKVLIETAFTKEIRIVMRKGQMMKEHQTAFPIVVEIIDGEISFGVKGDILDLKKGGLLALEGGVPHDLKAVADSIIRLTLNKSDKINRVFNVIRD